MAKKGLLALGSTAGMSASISHTFQCGNNDRNIGRASSINKFATNNINNVPNKEKVRILKEAGFDLTVEIPEYEDPMREFVKGFGNKRGKK